ncbi:diaminopimelate epimerase [Desulfobulbus alkaliphilus]|uniref:diaminopimelate epimerase n=1 Tax=Desulfobulbus alkaliphilus TaxID=869814 RepID=UPI001965130C|nr:diaminopimelate epimerase [Desulfobulbus alkaliphilus]MBM9537695.1 diaminopimelate epimerase [Desulfobulbus alkaliphilus]
MRTIKMPVPFCKMSGAGNDFIIIDHRKAVVPVALMPDFVRLVCRRRFSVGADGLFFIELSRHADFKWRFFNSDGSEAAMCGNGARCVARFAYMHGIAAARMRFETQAGIIDAAVADTQVTIGMPPPQAMRLDLAVNIGKQRFIVHSVDTGVPHIVLFDEEVDDAKVAELGRQLRHHPLFAPAGTNVNFVARSQEGFHLRTYERGVEAETMACGTGAVACALVAAARGLAQSPVTVCTSGGTPLTVRFIGGGDQKPIEQVLLQGPAHLVYRGEITAEALL